MITADLTVSSANAVLGVTWAPTPTARASRPASTCSRRKSG